MQITLENHGNIWLANPLDAEAIESLHDGTSDDAQWFGDALVIDQHYVDGFLQRWYDAGGEVV